MKQNQRNRAYSYIRMSTALQLKGNSLERQMETARRFAATHQLDLQSDFSLHDIGVSAFKGKNAATGNLGKILTAISDGRIPVGSWLLIESLDRLSRQDVYAAFGLFSQILNAGIVVATTAGEGQIYTRDAVSGGQIWMLLGEMMRSNDESIKKNIRGLSNWALKRSRIATRKLTATCPGWLRLNEEKTAFDVIEQRADVVRRIFDESIAGMGIVVIARRLNDDKIPTFTEADGWHPSSVNKILNNRSVFGEFQPHTRDENNRPVPEGPPIPNYFPVIISQDQFFVSQAQRSQRLIRGRGRKGTAFSNLFAGLLKCHYCGRHVQYENKGDGSKGGRYLICEGARRNMGCERTRWRYDHFEASVLAFVEELNLGSLYASGTDREGRSLIETRMKAIEGELSSLGRAQTNVLLLQGEVGMDQIKAIAEQLGRLQAKITLLLKDREGHQAKLAEITEAARRFSESRDNVKLLLARLKSEENSDLYRERAQIASRLHDLVDEITVAPVGTAPNRAALDGQLKAFANTMNDLELSDMVDQQIERVLPTEGRRFFIAKMKDGRSRKVMPDQDDPLRFHQMVVESRSDVSTIHQLGPFVVEINSKSNNLGKT